ncbi:DUF397 domain-containing protein [Solwaraspora sp. WMMD406]|uniref:DUF397 domain-containing protein n=1 Tax=Solwaraspora sp. WMMD406 TaxID=3016095 RepID=UPI0024160131|nr:DUF397 domain-containing protein [Solwaraspora sp. WMMD406]MDG4767375.1 DUF397 domain-containing protein [Solwaraspora sp. WMMD406]
MTGISTAGPVWRKSRRCEATTCVEVAGIGPMVGVRDSTDPDVHLEFSAPAWTAFVARFSAGGPGRVGGDAD